MQQVDLTVTNSAATPAGLPQRTQFFVIHNPHATASLALSFGGTPAINGIGVTLGPLGSQTFDAPSGVSYPVGTLKLISSVASQAATILYA